MVAHPLVIAGPTFGSTGKQPLIVERTDREFVKGIYGELRTETGVEQLLRSQAHRRDGTNTLKLYQPLQRTFHVMMVELRCETFGFPRLDPAKVDRAGIVIRRINRDGPQERVFGWMLNGDDVQGWVEFRTAGEENADPAAERRRPVAMTGNREINKRLLSLTRRRVAPVSNLAPVFNPHVFTERTSPAFPVPPDVARDAGRTIVFGVMQLASNEGNELAPSPLLSDDDVLAAGHYPTFFREGPARVLPQAGTTFDRTSVTNAVLTDFLGFLRQLSFEFGVLEDTTEGAALRAILGGLTLPDDSRTALAFITQATAILLRNQDGSFTMPAKWPAISADTSRGLLDAVKRAMQSRLERIAPVEGRFDDTDALYKARLYVRVRSDHGCPPKLWWSDYSEPFRIAPWFDNNDRVRPPLIQLPDLTNLDQLKPNVAFAVPPRLQDLLSGNSPEDFLDGKASKKDSGFGLMWICSFSLPIIMLCAFIVLNIFLSLFNLIFQWLFFIKICIPFPTKK